MEVAVTTGEPGLGGLLEFACAVLEVDALLLTETVGAQEVVRSLAGDGERFGIGVGTGCRLEESYASRVVDGSDFRVIPDTLLDPKTAELPSTSRRGIGAYMGAAVFGPSRTARTLSGLSRQARPAFAEADGQVLEIVAHLVAQQIDRDECGRSVRAKRRRVHTRFESARRRSVFQAIVDLRSGHPVGYEALTTFVGTDPATAFGEAHDVGLGVPLEIATIRDSLSHLNRLPDDCYISVKVSRAAACSVALVEAIGATLATRVVVDITEHTADTCDETGLEAHLRALRALGVRIEVGDVSPGYPSLRDALILQPDFIKLGVDAVRDIDTDPVRSAGALALADFAGHVGAILVADGVGTPAERDRLVEAGLKFGQGDLFAPPQDLPDPSPVPSASSVGAAPRRAARRRFTPTSPEGHPSLPGEAKPVLYCPSCHRQLVRIDAIIDDRDFEMRSCSHCDLRWWESDSAPTSRAAVLALMSASARGTQ